MPDPLPLPIRVLIKGHSQVVWTSWMGGPRTDLAYPRALEGELLAAGRPAEVRVEALPAITTKRALRAWEHEVVPFSPDVVVLHIGQMDMVHYLLPGWLEQHAHSLKTRPGPLRERYRFVLNKVWRALAVLQQKADARSDASKARRRPQRVVADLERLITRVRNIASPLVLLPDFAPLGKTYTTWFPGLVARSVVLDRMIEDMLARLDNPDIRRFRVTDVLAGMDLPDGPTPDGGHYTPPVHRAVARAMAAEILEWASTQPHLALPVPGGDAAVNGQRLADGRHRDLSGA